MPEMNRRFVLRERPVGCIDERTFGRVEEAVPEIGEGEALIRTRWISVDPANRAWLDETPTYLPPVAIGEVMRASGVGEVVASKSPDYNDEAPAVASVRATSGTCSSSAFTSRASSCSTTSIERLR